MNLNTKLFVDLLFTSKKILDLTTSDDILVLIGESPAYLGPILKIKNDVLHSMVIDTIIGHNSLMCSCYEFQCNFMKIIA